MEWTRRKVKLLISRCSKDWEQVGRNGKGWEEVVFIFKE